MKIQKSTDGGKTWKDISAPPYFSAVQWYLLRRGNWVASGDVLYREAK